VAFGTEVPPVVPPRRPGRPDPPQRCVDLQRLTAGCSQSSGFPAPPAPFVPFGVDPGVFHPAAGWAVSCPAWIPLLALRSLSRTSPAASSALHVRRATAVRFASAPPPVGFVASSVLPARGIHFPAPPSVPGSHRFLRASPRRGLPHPLRSASAVSHDPGGFRLPEPCGVFRPLTPARFVSLLPHRPVRLRRAPRSATRRPVAGPRPSEDVRCPAWGVVTRSRGSRSGRTP